MLLELLTRLCMLLLKKLLALELYLELARMR